LPDFIVIEIETSVPMDNLPTVPGQVQYKKNPVSLQSAL
jgi:hypothetical protein